MRRVGSVVCALVILAIALACGRPPALSALPQRESDRFMACLRQNYASYCPQSSRECVDGWAARYSGERDEHERQRWLDRRGCTRDVSGFSESEEDMAAARRDRIGEIETSYDEFTRSRRIDYRGRTTGGARFVFHASVIGQSVSSFFGVVSSGANWAYLNCHALNMLADQDPVSLPPAQHRGDVRAGNGVTEMVSVELSGDALQALSDAHTIRFRICSDVFGFEPDHVTKVHEFVEAIRAAASPAP